MRNPVLGIAIAFALAVPCTALAEDKDKQRTFEVNDCGFGPTIPVTPSSSGSGAATKPIKVSQYATGRRQHSKRSSTGGGNPTTGKPLTTGSGQVASPTMQKKSVNPETNRGLAGQETGRRALEERINTRGK
jgi:hypothetical protein